MSVGSSRRRAVQKAQGTFEGARERKERLAREAMKCSDCDGDFGRFVDGEWEACETCNGTGKKV